MSAPPARVPDPGRDVRGLLDRVDGAGDRLARRLRGRPWVDAAAAVVSNLSDYGLVWVLTAAVQSRRPGPARRRAVVALCAAGIASYTVNRAVKRAIGRGRPGTGTGTGAGTATGTGSPGLPVRRPTSSSFPSGHTLAAFCTAGVIARGAAGTGAAFGFASAVALSRVHLRAHHPSDVAGGAVIGAALGAALRPLVRRVAGV